MGSIVGQWRGACNGGRSLSPSCGYRRGRQHRERQRHETRAGFGRPGTSSALLSPSLGNVTRCLAAPGAAPRRVFGQKRASGASSRGRAVNHTERNCTRRAVGGPEPQQRTESPGAGQQVADAAARQQQCRWVDPVPGAARRDFEPLLPGSGVICGRSCFGTGRGGASREGVWSRQDALTDSTTVGSDPDEQAATDNVPASNCAVILMRPPLLHRPT
jgi:hypothetical protein